MEYGKVYEFILMPHMHAYHQHVRPFQMVTDVGSNGFQAKAGDWYDTIGGTKNKEYRFRISTRGYTGKQVTHCHILPVKYSQKINYK